MLWSLSKLGLIAALCGIPVYAAAVDGVLEINPACAAGPGCFPGDEPGFPVRIELPGSYRLTGNLDLLAVDAPDPNVSAIEIHADDVSLDLNGFALFGPTPCEESGPCPPAHSATASGIAIAVNERRSSVRNGEVRGFPNDGVYLGALARITDLRVSEVGDFGIHAGPNSIVARCSVGYAGYRGIEASDRSVIVHNTSTDAGQIGISAFSDSVVAHNRVVRGGGDGFDLTDGNVILDNTVYNTGAIGIDSSNDCAIARNVMASTGSASLDTGLGSGYSENVVDTTGATITGAGLALACNSANGVVTCPP